MGVIRHTDAGYEKAATVAVQRGVRIPMAPDDQCQPGGRPPRLFADLWRELEPLGRDEQTGGYRRYSWTPADAACRAWFTSQATSAA